MEGATPQASVTRLQGSEDRPLCECHGEPMWRNRARNRGWICAVRSREYGRRYRAAHPDVEKARLKRWLEENPDHYRYRESRRVRLFGSRHRLPDQEFATFARRLRDERKAALKVAA